MIFRMYLRVWISWGQFKTNYSEHWQLVKISDIIYDSSFQKNEKLPLNDIRCVLSYQLKKHVSFNSWHLYLDKEIY
jgi:hypothetical protein